jgi:SAM-dependent methyltransferase
MGLSKLLQAILPKKLKSDVKVMLTIPDLRKRLQRLELEVMTLSKLISGGDMWEHSRQRWREANPNRELTWGKEIAGKPFIDKVAAHFLFTPSTQVLEIGPGYGRLLKSLLAQSLPFLKYTGLDLSAKNVAFLTEQFKDQRISFLQGDAEIVSLPSDIDLIYSSLTFKHLFPTCERTLTNLSRCLKKDSRLIFDLVEGDGQIFEKDTVTYLRSYSRTEIKDILERTGFQLVAFDKVEHAPDYIRLLVVAQKLA